MAKTKPALQVRAPKNADDFVTGRPAAGRQRPAASAPPPPKRRGLVQRKGGAERARITVYLEPEVAEKLRRHCFEEGLQVSDLAAAAITRFVAKLAP